ncbi:sugar phosphate nucleotidyltransferase [candidate division KSB1 bacterium]
MRSNLTSYEINKTDIVILCGGLGSRLQNTIKDKPKPMAEIGATPFLDILINYIGSFGFKRFVLCTGYKAEIIQQFYERKQTDKEFIFSSESEPLGTGGALKNAEKYIFSDDFFVMNGDSLCKLDFNRLYSFHTEKSALISIALSKTYDIKDCGSVILDKYQRIMAFNEKITDSHKTEFGNAGIYCMKKSAFSLMPQHGNFSLELDFFPNNLDKAVYGYITNQPFIDIGTPGRYEKAKLLLINKK